MSHKNQNELSEVKLLIDLPCGSLDGTNDVFGNITDLMEEARGAGYEIGVDLPRWH